MDTKTQFSSGEWDTKSETSTFHLSYIIKTLLPTRWVGWKNGIVSKTYDKFLIPSIMNDSITCIPTGSLAEGLGIPDAVLYNPSPENKELFSDVDALIVYKTWKFSTIPLAKTYEGFDGYLCYDHSPPGYVRVCMLGQTRYAESVVMDIETGKAYFSSAIVTRDTYSSFCVSIQEKDITKFHQGPAMSMKDSNTEAFDVEGNPFNVPPQPLGGTSMDFVPAFHCTPWPEVASGWTMRARESEWLETKLVESVIQDGCHIVAVPSKSSSNPDIEWRLSFSASEGRLAREAVTDYQRQCYMYMKILRTQIMKQKGNILSSYVFKSVFFHCCEILPVKHWQDHPGNCILYMLDLLVEWLKRKHVGTYFLPENNLIRHLNEEEFKRAIKIVENMRSDPISPVLDFLDDKCLLQHPLDTPFRVLVQPVIDDMKIFEQHRDKKASIEQAFSNSVLRICFGYIRDHSNAVETFGQGGEIFTDPLGLNKYQDAIRVLWDFTQWLLMVDTENTFVGIVNSFGDLDTLEKSLRFYKAAVCLTDEFPELAACRGKLACFYHASAYTDEKNVNDEYLKRAEELFEQVFTETKESAIDYAKFLIKQERYEEAMEVLRVYLEKQEGYGNQGMTTISYSIKEINTLDDRLKKHVNENGTIKGDELSFAYYYMVKCLCAHQADNTKSELSRVMANLEAHKMCGYSTVSFDILQEARELMTECSDLPS